MHDAGKHTTHHHHAGHGGAAAAEFVKGNLFQNMLANDKFFGDDLIKAIGTSSWQRTLLLFVCAPLPHPMRHPRRGGVS